MRFTSSRGRRAIAGLDRRARAAAVLSCAAALLAAGCDKSVGPFEVLPPLEPSSLEPTAGSWRMILLTGPSQIAVPAPATVTSAAYVAELDAIKASQANLTSDQQKAIAYWSGGGVMRWNQIVRELVARYNLPPAPEVPTTYLKKSWRSSAIAAGLLLGGTLVAFLSDGARSDGRGR